MVIADQLDSNQVKVEWLKCSRSCAYFIYTYCRIYDAPSGDWIPFVLWPEQKRALDDIISNQLVIILKSRQLGMTWLVLCYILWRLLFRPIFTSLVFSRREIEAIYLLSDQRLRGIYAHLPKWMRVKQVITDASHDWVLSNGSVVHGFPTTAGDSYTAGLAFVDEADLVPDLDNLMTAVKPTIDAGGQMILLSRSDKANPNSPFKRIYKAAKAGTSPWKAIFLSWTARPDRTQAWYDLQKADILARTTALDDLYEQYPATDEEALAPAQLDRRIPFKHILKCYREMTPLEDASSNLPFLKMYVKPEPRRAYVIGADPAEGNPGSDDSVACVLDALTREEMCVLAGKIEPKVFASYLMTLSRMYNHSRMLIERNNHGHAVILALMEVHNAKHLLLPGEDLKAGWQTTSKSKDLMYSTGVDEMAAGRAIIHSTTTKEQLSLIEGSSLEAPEGEHDDYAIAFMLALYSLAKQPVGAFAVSYVEH